MMRKELIVIVFAIAFIMAKGGNAQTIIGDPINYYSERVSADSLDKIFSKRIPVELGTKNCTLEDLTKHLWLSVHTKICGPGGYFIYTFRKNGKVQLDVSSENQRKYHKHSEESSYYLSDTPDLQFDTTRIGNKRGRYLILKFKNDSTVAVKRIVKCSDGSLLEIYDNSCLGMYSLKPLKEPYEEVIKNGYLTIPFEDYGFVFWECSKE